MRHTFLALIVLGVLPAAALADGRRYDRGDRYKSHDTDRSRFDIAIGFGSGGYRDSGFFGFSYGRGYGYAPRYCPPPPPPIVYRPAPCPPPVVYCPPPVYYRPIYYYGRPCYPRW